MHAHTCMINDVWHAWSFVPLIYDHQCLPYMLTNACPSCLYTRMSSIPCQIFFSMPAYTFVLWVCFYLVWIMSLQELIWHTHVLTVICDFCHPFLYYFLNNLQLCMRSPHQYPLPLLLNFSLRLLKLLLWNSINYLLQCSDPQYMLQYPPDLL